MAGYSEAQPISVKNSSVINPKPTQVERINKDDTQYPQMRMAVTEFKINEVTNPDIAEINISQSTPVERYIGSGKIKFIFISSGENKYDAELEELHSAQRPLDLDKVAELEELQKKGDMSRVVGIIRENKEGEIETMTWDPLTQGGARGIEINGGDTFQIIMTGPTKYYEYWTPKGFMSKRDGELVGHQDLLFLIEGEIDEDGKPIPEDKQVSKEFIEHRDVLLSYVETVNNERS